MNDDTPKHPASGQPPDVWMLAHGAVAAVLRQEEKAQARVRAAGRDLEEAKAAVKAVLHAAEQAGIDLDTLPRRSKGYYGRNPLR